MPLLPPAVITPDSSANHQFYTHTNPLPPSLLSTGGPTVLLNTQGRDCTALFEAFHPFTDRPATILSKMKEVRAVDLSGERRGGRGGREGREGGREGSLDRVCRSSSRLGAPHFL